MLYPSHCQGIVLDKKIKALWLQSSQRHSKCFNSNKMILTINNICQKWWNFAIKQEFVIFTFFTWIFYSKHSVEFNTEFRYNLKKNHQEVEMFLFQKIIQIQPLFPPLVLMLLLVFTNDIYIFIFVIKFPTTSERQWKIVVKIAEIKSK